MAEPAATTGGVAIVPMAAHHLDVVVAIEAAEAPRPWSRATFADERARADRRYLVAVDDVGAVVGFAGVALLAGEAHVMTVHVAAAARRRSIGRRLVGALLASARDADCHAATLEVAADNDPARRLYGRLGFVDRGRRPGYYPDGQAAVIMWRDDLAGVGRPSLPADDLAAVGDAADDLADVGHLDLDADPASRPTATLGG